MQISLHVKLAFLLFVIINITYESSGNLIFSLRIVLMSHPLWLAILVALSSVDSRSVKTRFYVCYSTAIFGVCSSVRLLQFLY
jgi:hypothetical protein